jgi:hypothetical protein
MGPYPVYHKLHSLDDDEAIHVPTRTKELR